MIDRETWKREHGAHGTVTEAGESLVCTCGGRLISIDVARLMHPLPVKEATMDKKDTAPVTNPPAQPLKEGQQRQATPHLPTEQPIHPSGPSHGVNAPAPDADRRGR